MGTSHSLSPSSPVVIAGRDRVLLAGLSCLLERDGWKRRSVSDLTEAASAVRKSRAQALVVDVALLDDTRYIRAARKAVKDLRVLAVVGERNPHLVRVLHESGVEALLHRSSDEAEIGEATKALREGEAYESPALKMDESTARRGRRGLSPRETEVIRLLGYGNTNKVVAEKLGISEKTVEAHRANIKRKLGARGLSDLVRFAISTGLVDTRDPIEG